MTKRVYHPTGNAWQDVADDRVEDWSKAGWLKSKPKHVDDSEALPPGEGYTVPDVVFDDGGFLPEGVNKVRNETGKSEPLAKVEGK